MTYPTQKACHSSLSDARQYHFLPSPFAMYRGGQLHAGQLAYETWGKLNSTRTNALLILPGMSPDAHAATHPNNPAPGWWQTMVGPHKPIDTCRYFVICINSLGSDKGSSGPASINPATKAPYRLSFPELSLEDTANAAYDLVTRGLGIPQLAVLVGCSMGGMSALAYLLNHPHSARAHISINSATAAQPFAIAMRSLQREAIITDPHWKNGHYTEDNLPVNGMAIARKLGVISYRSAPEWQQRFSRTKLDQTPRKSPLFAPEFEIESYLQHHADRFIGQFDPNCYLYLSQASDWFDAGEYAHNHVYQALARIQLENALVMGSRTDTLFPLEQQQEIADGLHIGGAQVDFKTIDSLKGHDAFLVDTKAYGEVICSFLNNTSTG